MSVVAYIHLPAGSSDPREVFYVGKGSVKRSRNMTSRSKEHKAYAATLAGVDIGVLECSTHDAAYELERGLIKCLKRMGATLVNKTAGGGGLVGYKMSAETKAKLSAAKMGDKNPMKRPDVVARAMATMQPKRKDAARKTAETRKRPEVAALISESQRRSWQNPDVRERRLSAIAASGMRELAAERFRLNNPSTTEAGRKLRAEQSSARWADGAMRKAMSEALAAAWTPERRAAMSANNPSHRPEVNAKKSAALKGIKAPEATCPHCGLSGGENIMKRWHFNRCKKKG